MPHARWTWKAALAATAVVAAAALVPPRTARSDDDESEALELSADVAALHDALANWDDDEKREKGLAVFLDLGSRDALVAPVEDPTLADGQ
jgi:hypothetical protein